MPRCFNLLCFKSCLLCMHMSTIKANLKIVFSFLLFDLSFSDNSEMKRKLQVPLVQNFYFIKRITCRESLICFGCDKRSGSQT